MAQTKVCPFMIKPRYIGTSIYATPSVGLSGSRQRKNGSDQGDKTSENLPSPAVVKGFV